MNENSIQDYIVGYLPTLFGRFLDESPIPNMNGTNFSLQITIQGEKNLTFGITSTDAAKIMITEGEMDKPTVAITLPEDIIKPLVNNISKYIARWQYDILKDTKGTVDTEIEMNGGMKLPLHIVLNGADAPSFKMSGSAGDLGGIAAGSLEPTQAFMEGKIKILGDIGFAVMLSRLKLNR